MYPLVRSVAGEDRPIYQQPQPETEGVVFIHKPPFGM